MESPRHGSQRGPSRPARLLRHLLLPALVTAAVVPAAAPAQDPATVAQIAALHRQLAAHPYFSQVDYTVDTSHPRVIFVLERPPRDEDDYYRALVAQLSPYLSELERVFRAEYVDPLGLERKADQPRTVLAVLATKSRYEVEYPRVTGMRTESSRAHFDPESRLAITYEDHFAEQVDVKDRREAVLHEFVHALQFAYFSGRSGSMPAPQWFNEGLAEFRSVTRVTASQLRDPDIDPHHIRILAMLLTAAKYRSLVAPIRDLVEIDGPGYIEVLRAAARRTGRDQSDPRFEQLAMTAFYAQSCIFTWFLHNGEGGRYREAFKEYAGRVLRGERGVEAFADAFEAFDLDAVEQEFFACVGEQMKLRNWTPAAIDAVARGSSSVIASGDAGGGAAASPPDFDFAALAWRPEDWRRRMIHALQLAAEGRFAAAGRTVDGVRAPESEAPFVARAVGHLEALTRVRDVYLERAIESGRKMRYRLGGKTPRGIVLRCDDEQFVLKVGRRERVVPREKLIPSVLLDNGEDVGLFEELGGATAALLALLDGADDEDIDDHLAGAAASAVLRDDLGRFRKLLDADVDMAWAPIAALQPPADAAAARTMLDTLGATVAAHRDSGTLRARRGELEDLARYLVHRSFDAADPEALGLHGKVVSLGEEFRVEYDFESDDQLADFHEASGMVPGFDGLEFGTPRGDYMRIEGGELVASGKAERQFAVPLQAPFRISWKAKTDDAAMFLIGCCRKAIDSVALTSLLGDLRVFDLPQGIGGDASRDTDRDMYHGTSYRYEIEHDGEAITVKVDGRVTGRAENIGSLGAGTVFFYMNGIGPVRLDDLTIQGRVDPVAARRMLGLRADRVARGLFDDD